MQPQVPFLNLFIRRHPKFPRSHIHFVRIAQNYWSPLNERLEYTLNMVPIFVVDIPKFEVFGRTFGHTNPPSQAFCLRCSVLPSMTRMTLMTLPQGFRCCMGWGGRHSRVQTTDGTHLLCLQCSRWILKNWCLQMWNSMKLLLLGFEWIWHFLLITVVQVL